MLKINELLEENKRTIEDNNKFHIYDLLDYFCNEYISDSYYSYCDNLIPIYYYDLIELLKNTDVDDYMRDKDTINIENYDLYGHIQSAYFNKLIDEIHDKDSYIKEVYILNKLIDKYDITEIEEDIYYSLVDLGELRRCDKVYQLDDIVEEIVEEVK